MAGSLREVRYDHPCPICGKPDWCARVEEINDRGQEVQLILCKRSDQQFQKGTYAVHEGFDGQRYILVGNGPESAVYQELEEWKRQNATKKHEFKTNRPEKERAEKLVPRDVLEPRDNAYCSMVYRCLLSQLTLDPKDRTYLRSKGFNDKLIEELGCRSFPENDYLRREYKNRTRSSNRYRKSICKELIDSFGPDALKGVPGFYETKWGWDIYGFSGILFPMYDIDGNIYRLRIRRNYLDVNAILQDDGALFYIDKTTHEKIYVGWGGEYTVENGRKVPYKKKGASGKYRTLSSWEQDREAAKAGYLANKLHNGCRSGNCCSFYGLGEPDRSFWFITEGEPKAALASKLLASPCVSIPGVDSYRLVSNMDVVRSMMEHGARNFVVAYDADKATNNSVLAKERELCSALSSLNVPVFIADWDIEKGKGIDDALIAGASLKFRPVVKKPKAGL